MKICIILLVLVVINVAWCISHIKNKKAIAKRIELLRREKTENGESFTEESLKNEIEPNTWYAWVLGLVVCLDVWIFGAIATHLWAAWFFKVNANDNPMALFGDSFGAVNALISAFAFAGMIVAFILQRYELKLQRKELQMTREEMKEQTAEFEKQNKIMKKQAFEETFFKMLDVHRANVSSINVDGEKGAEIFARFVDILSYRYKAADESLKVIETIAATSKYKEAKKCLATLTEDERKEFCMKYAYGHFLYGDSYHVSYKKDGRFKELEDVIRGIYKNHIPVVVGHEQMYRNGYFDGQLGHYYRTVYQIVTFVDGQELLGAEEKYRYVKMLRAQMSDYEQILFYYNALSNMGHPWVTPSQPYSLIIKYRLIKNLPHFFEYFYADPRKYFENEIKQWEKEMGEDFFEQLQQLD